MAQYKLSDQLLLEKLLSKRPKMVFGLSANYSRHNISPDGLIETEKWSDSRNIITTLVNQNGVTFKI